MSQVCSSAFSSSRTSLSIISLLKILPWRSIYHESVEGVDSAPVSSLRIGLIGPMGPMGLTSPIGPIGPISPIPEEDRMFNYAEMKTAELIDLLFKEEDRATLEHAREMVARGEEAAGPLREILANEDYWYEGQGGDHWIVVHAINILGAMRDEQTLPLLIEMVPHAYFSNHDSAVEVLPAALAEYGATALEPYMKFIGEYRGAYHDNPDFGHCRHTLSAALTRIALRDEAVHARVADFIIGLFADPQEDDKIFLSFSADHPIALDKAPGKERGLQAVRAAYERGMISQEING